MAVRPKVSHDWHRTKRCHRRMVVLPVRYRTAGGGETNQSATTEIMAQLVSGQINQYHNYAITAYPSPDPAVTTIVFYRAFASGTKNGSGRRRGTCKRPSPMTAATRRTTRPHRREYDAGHRREANDSADCHSDGTSRHDGPTHLSDAGRRRRQRLLTTINNSTTTYTDTTADSAMTISRGHQDRTRRTC